MPDVKPASPVVFVFQGSLTAEVVATLVGVAERPIEASVASQVLQIDITNPANQPIAVRVHSFNPQATVIQGDAGLIANVEVPEAFTLQPGETGRADFTVLFDNLAGQPKSTELVIFAKADPA